MQLWVVYWGSEDSHHQTWFSSRSAAQEELNRLQRDWRSLGFPEKEVAMIQQINFPRTKPEVIRWLNVHCTNGSIT